MLIQLEWFPQAATGGGGKTYAALWGSKGGKGVALYMYIAPTDVLIVFDEVSKGDENLRRS